MRRRLLVCCFLLLPNLPAVAQQPDMKQWLNTGNDKERAEKLLSLGVGSEEAELAIGDKVEWRTIRGEANRRLAIMFAPCGGLDAAYLYLLQRTDQGWHVTDSSGFDCHYDENVSIETAQLRGPDADDVVVHHECVGHGTGYLEQHLNVFAVDSLRLKLILDTEEILKVSDWPEVRKLLQRSAFAWVPTPGSPSQVIEETECTRLNGKLTIQTRSFHWSAESFRFVPSTFIKVDPSDERSKGACR